MGIGEQEMKMPLRTVFELIGSIFGLVVGLLLMIGGIHFNSTIGILFGMPFAFFCACAIIAIIAEM